MTSQATNMADLRQSRSMSAAEYESEATDSDSDSISLTSTQAATYNEGDPFLVEQILAEKKEDGQTKYLLEWRDFPLHEATWEPSEHLETDENGECILLEVWEKKKAEKKVDRSIAAKYEQEKLKQKREHDNRHRRRNAKRRRLGLPETEPIDKSLPKAPVKPAAKKKKNQPPTSNANGSRASSEEPLALKQVPVVARSDSQSQDRPRKKLVSRAIFNKSNKHDESDSDIDLPSVSALGKRPAEANAGLNPVMPANRTSTTAVNSESPNNALAKKDGQKSKKSEKTGEVNSERRPSMGSPSILPNNGPSTHAQLSPAAQDTPPVKRGPGRPRKHPLSAVEPHVSPNATQPSAAVVSPSTRGGAVRGRGRPRGSGIGSNRGAIKRPATLNVFQSVTNSGVDVALTPNPPKKRKTLADNAADQSKEPVLFSNMRLGRKAYLQGRALADRAPDPSVIDLVNPKEAANLSALRKTSLANSEAVRTVSDRTGSEETASGLAGPAQVSGAPSSDRTMERSQSLDESAGEKPTTAGDRPAKPKRRPSVRFADAMDGLLFDEPAPMENTTAGPSSVERAAPIGASANHDAALAQTAAVSTPQIDIPPNAQPSLWVGNIHDSIHPPILGQIFEKYGGLHSVRKVPGEPFGFVNYLRVEDAVLGLRALQGFVFCEGAKPFIINFALPKYFDGTKSGGILYVGGPNRTVAGSNLTVNTRIPTAPRAFFQEGSPQQMTDMDSVPNSPSPLTGSPSTAIVTAPANPIVPVVRPILKKIKLDQYQKRSSYVMDAESVITKATFGSDSSVSARISFNGLRKDDADGWKRQLINAGDLFFDLLTLSADFGSQKCFFQTTLASPTTPAHTPHLALGNIHTDAKDADTIDAVAENLKLRMAGLTAVIGDLVVLLFPTGGDSWTFINNEKGSTGSSSLKYYVFRSPYPIDSKTKTHSLKDGDVDEKPEKKVPRILHEGFDYDSLIPPPKPDASFHNFYLVFPPAANETQKYLETWLKACNPECQVLLSSRDSWNSFIKNLQENESRRKSNLPKETPNGCSVDGGAIVIHETLVPMIQKIPNLSRIILRHSYLCVWSLADESIRYPMVGQDTCQLSLTQLMRSGGAILLAPSFILANPVETCQLLKWIQKRARISCSSSWKLVSCNLLSKFLLETAIEKDIERSIHERTFASATEGKDAAAIRKKISYADCAARFDSYGIVEQMLDPEPKDENLPKDEKLAKDKKLQRYPLEYDPETLDEQCPIVYADASIEADDEVGLSEWFASWALCRLEDHRRFVIIGTGETADAKRLCSEKGAVDKNVGNENSPPLENNGGNENLPVREQSIQHQSIDIVSSPQPAARTAAEQNIQHELADMVISDQPAANSIVNALAVACPFYHKGTCSRGSTCSFRHDLPNEPQDGEQPQGKGAGETPVEAFIAITGANSQTAEAVLQQVSNNVEKAVEKFYGGEIEGLLGDIAPSGQENVGPQVSKAGIVKNELGRSFVPFSVRTNGSSRPEIPVRPGYIPPEDKEVYKNRRVINGFPQYEVSSSSRTGTLDGPGLASSRTTPSIQARREKTILQLDGPSEPAANPAREVATDEPVFKSLEPTSKWYKRRWEEGKGWEHLTIVTSWEKAVKVLGI